MTQWHLATLLLLACLGCGKSRPMLPADLQTALRDFPTFELYSIDPEWHEPETPRDPNLPRIHGYIVLGSTKITDAAVRQKLTTELEQAAAAADGSAACHDPRHMIRLQHQGQTIIGDLSDRSEHAVPPELGHQLIPLSHAIANAIVIKGNVLLEQGAIERAGLMHLR